MKIHANIPVYGSLIQMLRLLKEIEPKHFFRQFECADNEYDLNLGIAKLGSIQVIIKNNYFIFLDGFILEPRTFGHQK